MRLLFAHRGKWKCSEIAKRTTRTAPRPKRIYSPKCKRVQLCPGIPPAPPTPTPWHLSLVACRVVWRCSPRMRIRRPSSVVVVRARARAHQPIPVHVRVVPTCATALAVLVHARATRVNTTHTETTPRHALLACVKVHALVATGTSPDVAFVVSEPAPPPPPQGPARCDALCFGVLERRGPRNVSCHELAGLRFDTSLFDQLPPTATGRCRV
jgi:hypothetical protein